MNFTTYDKAVDNEIRWMDKELKRAGVSLNMVLDKHCKDDVGVFQGSYDSGALTVNVAVCRQLRAWFPVLLHEFCHWEQDRENMTAWVHCGEYDDAGDACTIMNDYIKGYINKSQHVKGAINAVKAMELECERLTLKRLQKFDYIISQRKYAKEASAYIFYHDYIYKSGRWYNKERGKRSLFDKDILRLMPDNLDGAYKRPPKGLHDLFSECV
jgi:hypothetical protein